MKIFKYLKPYVWLILIILVLTYLQVQSNLLLPDYMAKIINDGILNKDNSVIYNNGLWMLLISFGGAIVSVGAGFLAAIISTAFARDVRRKVFIKVESFAVSEFDKISTSSLITRSTNDIQQIQNLVFMLLRMFLIAPLTAIGALQNAINTAPSLTWIIAMSAAVVICLMVIAFSLLIPKFTLTQKLVDRMNLVARENLTGLRVVRAFSKEKVEQQKFDDVNLKITNLNIFTNRVMAFMQPMMTLVMNLAVIAIIWYGASSVFEGNLQIGNMMAFMQYAMQVIMSFLMLSIMFIIVPRAAISVKRVNEVLATKPSINKPKKITPINALGKIEFKNVSFKYPGANNPVLENVSFVIEPGSTTAIIGSTGSGKSTLVNLIPRLYEASEGQVLLNGIDVKDVDLRDLHNRIGYVPQRGVLFSGTIKTNITYGNKNASYKVIKSSAKIAQADDFIKNMDGRFDYAISQGGNNVSGGQKQRLSIARALAIDPEMFIFDDSFSALDLQTDSNLRKALKEETEGKTVLIIGQRVSTIMHADKIVVLEEGRVVDQGTHEELMATNKVYQEIAHSQLSDEEIKNIDKLLLAEANNGK